MFKLRVNFEKATTTQIEFAAATADFGQQRFLWFLPCTYVPSTAARPATTVVELEASRGSSSIGPAAIAYIVQLKMHFESYKIRGTFFKTFSALEET